MRHRPNFFRRHESFCPAFLRANSGNAGRTSNRSGAGGGSSWTKGGLNGPRQGQTTGRPSTPLPIPPERTHLLLDSKASWVQVRSDPQDKLFEGFPEESIADWHERLGLES